MSYLILVRHGKSEWNKLGLWTGHTDVELVEEGLEEARKAGEAIADIEIHTAHVSELKRTHQTFHEMRLVLGKPDLEAKQHSALNERHYGIHTGKNKWQVKDEIGEEEFTRVRRGWNVQITDGETLKDVYDKVVPYYEQHILPELLEGKNVLVVAHGNTLRALIKYLENKSEEEVEEIEVGTGEVHVYHIGPDGVQGKEIRSVNEHKLKV